MNEWVPEGTPAWPEGAALEVDRLGEPRFPSPIPLGIEHRKTLLPEGDTWQRVLEATGQPASLTANAG